MRFFIIIGIASLCTLMMPACSSKISPTSQAQQAPKSAIDWAKRFLGTWENKTSQGSIFETWVQHASLELRGKSYKIKGQDTLVFETIKLIEQNDSLYYEPTVKNQNQGKAVRFKMQSMDEYQVVFENPTHDFPQKISYTFMGQDSLLAEISGQMQGVERRRKFPMRKIE
jgi:hypothetical protein